MLKTNDNLSLIMVCCGLLSEHLDCLLIPCKQTAGCWKPLHRQQRQTVVVSFLVWGRKKQTNPKTSASPWAVQRQVSLEYCTSLDDSVEGLLLKHALSGLAAVLVRLIISSSYRLELF